MTLLEPPLGTSADIRLLELLWLASAIIYYKLDDNIMEDMQWTYLSVELWERRAEITPYLAHSMGLKWPVTDEGLLEGENPLVSGYGIDYSPHTIASLILKKLETDFKGEVAHLARLCHNALVSNDKGPTRDRPLQPT